MADSQRQPISSTADLHHATGVKLSNLYNPGVKPSDETISKHKSNSVAQEIRRMMR